MSLEITPHKHPLDSADSNRLHQSKRREIDRVTSCFNERKDGVNYATSVGNTFIPKILVVEDNKLCRSIFANFLKAGGYSDVILAEDADIAYSIIENADSPFDIVFTDHDMPSELTGESLSEKIKNIYKATVIISISGNADYWLKKRPDLFNDAIQKPCSKDKILNTLTRFFP